MTERATPFHCPYCGDEDLRPREEPRGAWLCGGCRRVFTVTFVGLSPVRVAGERPAAGGTEPAPAEPDPAVEATR